MQLALSFFLFLFGLCSVFLQYFFVFFVFLLTFYMLNCTFHKCSKKWAMHLKIFAPCILPDLFSIVENIYFHHENLFTRALPTYFRWEDSVRRDLASSWDLRHLHQPASVISESFASKMSPPTPISWSSICLSLTQWIRHFWLKYGLKRAIASMTCLQTGPFSGKSDRSMNGTRKLTFWSFGKFDVHTWQLWYSPLAALISTPWQLWYQPLAAVISTSGSFNIHPWQPWYPPLAALISTPGSPLRRLRQPMPGSVEPRAVTVGGTNDVRSTGAAATPVCTCCTWGGAPDWGDLGRPRDWGTLRSRGKGFFTDWQGGQANSNQECSRKRRERGGAERRVCVGGHQQVHEDRPGLQLDG